MAARRGGRRNPAVDQPPGITLFQLLRDIKAFIRTDFGGRNQQKIISDRLTEDGIPVSQDTIAAYRSGAVRTRDTIKKYLEPRIDQIRRLIGF